MACAVHSLSKSFGLSFRGGSCRLGLACNLAMPWVEVSCCSHCSNTYVCVCFADVVSTRDNLSCCLTRSLASYMSTFNDECKRDLLLL